MRKGSFVCSPSICTALFPMGCSTIPVRDAAPIPGAWGSLQYGIVELFSIHEHINCINYMKPVKQQTEMDSYCVDSQSWLVVRIHSRGPLWMAPDPLLSTRQGNPTRMQILLPLSLPVFQGQINPWGLHIELLGSSSQVSTKAIKMTRMPKSPPWPRPARMRVNMV